MKPGAAFVLNIGDRQYPLSENMKAHCVERGYKVKRIADFLTNNAGLGKLSGLGEQFYEISR